jgi:hypothetical protein
MQAVAAAQACAHRGGGRRAGSRGGRSCAQRRRPAAGPPAGRGGGAGRGGAGRGRMVRGGRSREVGPHASCKSPAAASPHPDPTQSPGPARITAARPTRRGLMPSRCSAPTRTRPPAAHTPSPRASPAAHLARADAQPLQRLHIRHLGARHPLHGDDLGGAELDEHARHRHPPLARHALQQLGGVVHLHLAARGAGAGAGEVR